MAGDGARAGAVPATAATAGGVRPADERVDVLVVGAGPCGLAAAISCERAGLSAALVDRGCLVSGIYGYPTFMTFFSTAERLSIGGIPFSVATEKPTRRDALAYYRTVAEYFGIRVRQYEEVLEVVAAAGGPEVRGGGSGGSGGGGGSGGDGAAGAPPEISIARTTVLGATNTPPDSAGERWEDVHPGAVHPVPSLPARFRARSRTRSGRERVTAAHAVVVATGYFGHPNRLGVPGEDLPHVTHLFREGHEAFQLPVVVVGGGNSAVDAALDLYRAGARVTLVHFGPDLDPNVKPWVRPDAVNRIRDGSIVAHFESRVTSIEPETVVVRTPAGPLRVPALAVYPMLGYQPNNSLLEQLAVPIDAVSGIPAHDPETMETAVAGVYIAGVVASGFDANKTFIENGRYHGDLIARHLDGLRARA